MNLEFRIKKGTESRQGGVLKKRDVRELKSE
jgi:hypothetical protein